MNKFLFALIFISVSVFSQQEKDSIITVRTDTLFISKNAVKKSIKPKLFSDSDLKTIDSLLVDQMLNSSLIDTLEYVIDDKDIIGNS
jgi:membrane-bound lytic murein transglycosylase D